MAQAELINVTYGTSASASSIYNTSYPASEAADGIIGNDGNMWHSLTDVGPHWWKTDLGSSYPVQTIKVVARSGYLDRINGMSVTVHETSDASGPWVYSNVVNITSGISQSFILPENTAAKSIKVSGTPTDGWMSFAELYALTPASSDLIIRYTFDDDSSIMADTGLDFTDHSMSGGIPDYDTTNKVQGSGSSLWDGVNDQTFYGRPITADPLNDLGKGVTMSYWVHPDSTGANYMMTLVWDDDTGGNGIVNYPFATHFGTAGGATRPLTYYVGSTNVGAPSVPMDEWSHIAITHDFDSNTAIFYLNGEPVSTNTSMNDIPPSTTEYFRMGNRAGGYRYKGRLDDVQIYRNYVATPEEIKYLYSQAGGTLPIPPPLTGTVILLL